jgi:hypothetical protein
MGLGLDKTTSEGSMLNQTINHNKYVTNQQSAYANHIMQNNHEYGPTEQTMELLQKENKGKKMNTWENYYIQYFTYHNSIIEEHACAKLNPLFQLAHSIQSLHHTPGLQPYQLFARHRTGT